MGMLQDNKSRKKISNDPNNTKWTRDTTTFGQKILRSQGWQPGQFLGAQDSPHAALHSAASASYIRVMLKDDMKGLGFDRAKEDEVTGLDVFSDVLSRLNGKTDAAVQEDQDARLAIKTHRYVEMRWGPMRFVRGGLLVGDKLKEVAVVEGSGDSSSSSSTEATRSKKDKKSKKRKAEEEQDDSEAAAKKEKKEKKRRRKDGDEDDKVEKKKKRRKEDKDKTEKKAKKASKLKDGSDDSDDGKESDDKAARKKAKKEKKERKRERREKKEEKKRRKAAAESSSSDDDEDSDEDASRSATVTPAATSGTSTPLGNRNFVRSRYIAQKRQAVMDATALKQIFMVKA